MARRYAPQMIAASHDATRAADALREVARPAPVREPETVASWEAGPPPTPTPTLAPKPGRGSRIVVERVVYKPPSGGAMLDADDVFALLHALMRKEAHSEWTDRQAAAQSRQTLSRRTNGTTI